MDLESRDFFNCPDMHTAPRGDTSGKFEGPPTCFSCSSLFYRVPANMPQPTGMIDWQNVTYKRDGDADCVFQLWAAVPDGGIDGGNLEATRGFTVITEYTVTGPPTQRHWLRTLGGYYLKQIMLAASYVEDPAADLLTFGLRMKAMPVNGVMGGTRPVWMMSRLVVS
jgi:hypothetical protein